jgi:DNA polymerase I-like protein with 3'-5' exonuclease and polymerase domains
LEGALLVAVGMADETGWTKTWVFNHVEAGTVNQVKMVAEIQEEIDRCDRIVGHNLKFDLNWLRLLNVDFSRCRLYCTMLTEYLLRGQRIGDLKLHDLSIHYGITPKIDMVKTFWDAGWETTEIPLKILLPYLEQDCINTLAIFQRQAKRVMSNGKNFAQLVKIQNENTRNLSEIECNGMKFNKDIANSHVNNMAEKLAVIDTELKMAFGWDVNLNSGDELSVALFGGVLKRDGTEWVVRELKHDSLYYERKCVVEKLMQGIGFEPVEGTELKKEGYYSTDKNTLKQLHGKGKKLKQVKDWLLERSQLSKALETFIGDNDEKGLINKIQADGCLHGKYNQSVTKTGRLSGSDPNPQNLPRGKTSPIKQCIEPRYSWIMNADLSQIEWRAAGWLSQDKVMLQEINDKVDVHRDNAVNFFGAVDGTDKFAQLRTDAKVMTFRLIYGGTAYGFFMDQNMPRFSKNKWEIIVNKFWEKYKGLKEWQDNNVRYANNHDGTLVSPTGRLFVFDKDPKGGYSRRQICNYPVQSLATADIMPLAMCLIGIAMKKEWYESIMIGQVHDSIVFDVVDSELKKLAQLCVAVFRSLPKYLEQTFGFTWNVPLDGECTYGKNYQEQETMEL